MAGSFVSKLEVMQLQQATAKDKKKSKKAVEVMGDGCGTSQVMQAAFENVSSENETGQKDQQSQTKKGMALRKRFCGFHWGH